MIMHWSLHGDPVILLVFVLFTVTTASQVPTVKQVESYSIPDHRFGSKAEQPLNQYGNTLIEESVRSRRQTVYYYYQHATTRAPVVVTRTVSKKCKCGSVLSQTKFRIVGGMAAKPNSRPWMVALVTKRNFQFCGGVIINNKFVLTAAHCVSGQTPRKIFAVVGLHDKMNQRELDAGRRAISKITIHPNYDQVTVDNDIALLQLGSPLDFSSSVLPICLPSVKANFVGYSGTVSGWGATADKGPSSQTLREVVLPILPYPDCVRKFPVGEFTENMMCAGVNQGGQDACQGDSGGPMVLLQDGRWYLAGVVSWGNGCGQANQPGVYTNVTKYIAWIYTSTQGAVYCM